MKISLFTVSLFLFSLCADIDVTEAVDRNIFFDHTEHCNNTLFNGFGITTEDHAMYDLCVNITEIDMTKVNDYGPIDSNKKLHNADILFEDGNIYTGTVRAENYLPHGYGELDMFETDGKSYMDGTYTGHFEDGQICGLGTVTWADGSSYTGNYVCSARNGHGIMHYSNGDVYDGNWLNNRKHGSGTFKWADSSYYSGNYVYDTRSGHGVMHYLNGDVYDGNWLNGKRHGYGTITYAAGIIRSYAGYWENDQEYGYGVRTYSSGTVFKGMWNGSALMYLVH